MFMACDKNTIGAKMSNILKDKTLAIVGLGYVGLPLAVAFAKKGYNMVSYDINKVRIEDLKRNIDITNETSPDDLSMPNLSFTSSEEELSKADIFIVTVPTPIDEANTPDLSIVFSATRTVAKYVKSGDIVIYESTVYPGVTEDECVPIIEEISGLKLNKDFSVGYSPERINPGDHTRPIEKIKKIVSASNKEALEVVSNLYGSIIEVGIFECANIKTAEAAKVIENIQRDLNIALVNEFSIIFNMLGINTYDVLDAASTKWNFIRFEPGIVGGHCIGVDPYYLTHCAEKLGYHPEVILSGRRINNRMGEYIAKNIIKIILSSSNKISHPISVNILGFTFKENVPDIRNTKVIDIVKALEEFGVVVKIADPHADAHQAYEEYGINLTPLKDLEPANAVIVAVKHKEFVEGGWNFMTSFLKNEKVVVADLKRCLPKEKPSANIELWTL